MCQIPGQPSEGEWKFSLKLKDDGGEGCLKRAFQSPGYTNNGPTSIPTITELFVCTLAYTSSCL